MNTNKLKSLRQLKSWSQEDLAVKLNISTPAYSKIETGITDVNLSRLRQLAAIYNLSLIQLISYIDSEPIRLSEKEEMGAVINELKARVMELQTKLIKFYENKNPQEEAIKIPYDTLKTLLL